MALNTAQLFRELNDIKTAVDATHASVKEQNTRIAKLEHKVAIVWWLFGAGTSVAALSIWSDHFRKSLAILLP